MVCFVVAHITHQFVFDVFVPVAKTTLLYEPYPYFSLECPKLSCVPLVEIKISLLVVTYFVIEQIVKFAAGILLSGKVITGPNNLLGGDFPLFPVVACK